jgi:hypothetical protein
MKVLFCVSCFKRYNSGVGGHYHSYRTISKHLVDSGTVNGTFLLIGNRESSAFKQVQDRNKLFVHADLFHIVGAIRAIAKILGTFRIDVVHTYDSYALLFIKICSIFRPLRIVHTKCGGPNPGYYPYAPILIVFSRENQIWFENKRGISHQRVFLLPQRIDPNWYSALKAMAVARSAKVGALLSQLASERSRGCMNFLKITRFAPEYRESIIQAAASFVYLKENVRELADSTLYLIGAVRDQRIVDEIPVRGDVRVITDGETCSYAPILHEYASFCFCNGRSLMEAALFGNVMLCNSMRSAMPILIDEDTIDECERFNFSPRCRVRGNDERFLRRFQDVIKKKEERREYARKVFEQRFDVSTARGTYRSVYEGLRRYRPNIAEVLVHFAMSIKALC